MAIDSATKRQSSLASRLRFLRRSLAFPDGSVDRKNIAGRYVGLDPTKVAQSPENTGFMGFRDKRAYLNT